MAASSLFGSTSPILFYLILSFMRLSFFLSPCYSDPDPLQDFCVADLGSKVLVNGFVCKPVSGVTPDDFFFAGLAKEGNATANPFGANVTSANVVSFPGLNTLGLSMNRVDYAPGGVNIPHSHPRASELVLVVKGSLFIGFVSTGNVLFSKVVNPGEIFVIPKGLVHFQYNVGKEKALAITVFNSQLPGAVIIPPTLFASKPTIPSEILAKALQIDEEVVNSIKSKFGA